MKATSLLLLASSLETKFYKNYENGIKLLRLVLAYWAFSSKILNYQVSVIRNPNTSHPLNLL